MPIIRHTTSALLLIAMCTGSIAQASVIAIGAIKDNTLYEDAAGSLSNGAGQRFFVGRPGSGGNRRGLLAFDIAGSIPAGATINSVSLRLNMSNTTAGDKTIELHASLQDWGQGTSVASGGEGGGGPSTVGDATWLHTFYNTSFWATPGGQFSPTVSASLSVGGVGAYTWASTLQLVTDVQSWLDAPASNFGWFMLGDEVNNGSAKRFDSSENAVAANRPLLTIDYTAIPEPATASLMILGSILIRRLRCFHATR